MNTVWLTLHDHIRISLVDASPRDVRSVMRATGARECDDGQPSDIEIRFSAASASNGRAWRHLGERHLGEYGAVHDDNRFAFRNGRPGSMVEVELPNQTGAEPFRLIFSAAAQQPFKLLRSMINAKCVEKGLLGLHGTAFTSKDRGYVACGWPRGGKTGTLLAYLLNGAEYLAAEWVYVRTEDDSMFGVPEPIRLRDWHLRQGASRLANAGLKNSARLTSIRWAASAADASARLTSAVMPRIGKTVSKVASAVDRRRYIDRPAADWLGQDLQARSAALDTILIVGTHDSSETRIRSLSGDEAKRRLIALQDHDMSDLADAYRQWSFAISDASHWTAQFQAKRNDLMTRFVQTKTFLAVDHPHEVNLLDLHKSIEESLKESCLQSH